MADYGGGMSAWCTAGPNAH